MYVHNKPFYHHSMTKPAPNLVFLHLTNITVPIIEFYHYIVEEQPFYNLLQFVFFTDSIAPAIKFWQNSLPLARNCSGILKKFSSSYKI